MAFPPASRPIHTLREHATSLEAAITLTLAKPRKEPVHRLRTSTRRIEAQLELLALLPDLPEHESDQRHARKLLKKLRRAAGSVRDLDVQRALLKKEMAATSSKRLRRDARDLRRTLKSKRSTEAGKLLKLLKRQQQKLAPALERLLVKLEPAADLEISASRLSDLARGWYQRSTPPMDPNADADNLHAIRKAAKLARYIAEGAAGDAAREFESLQEAGGTWHDLLTLANVASEHLGEHSPLTRLFAHQHTAALESYRQALRSAQAVESR